MTNPNHTATRCAAVALAAILANHANAQDCNNNAIPDLEEFTFSTEQLDFEEGNTTDLTALAGNVFNGAPGLINFNITTPCPTDPGQTPDACNPGNFSIAFTNPNNCNFDSGQRESGFFFFAFSINPADDDVFLQFCSRYDAEEGDFTGIYAGNGRWDAPTPIDTDIAGVAVFAAADLFFNTPLLTLNVSGIGSHDDWRTRSLTLSTLPPGNYTAVFAFDSIDQFQNNTLGWQIDNIKVLRDEFFKDVNNNRVPDDCETFAYNPNDDSFFPSLDAAINSGFYRFGENLLVTPDALAGTTTFPADLFVSTIASLPSQPDQDAFATDLTIPDDATFVLQNNTTIANQNFGDITHRGTIELTPNANATVDDNLTIDTGLVTIPFGAFLDTTQSLDITAGTVRLLGGALANNNTINLGDTDPDNPNATIQGFGVVNADLDLQDAQILVQADTQIIGDVNLDHPDAAIEFQNGNLAVFGALTVNQGALNTPTPTANQEQSLFATGTITLGPAARVNTQSGTTFVLNTAADLDITATDNATLDLSNTEIRLTSTTTQTIEAPSTDLGPAPEALDPATPGAAPIRTLRVGPAATTATLTDQRDNDNNPNNNPEALYTNHLIIEPGATLDLSATTLYYEHITNLGNVINPANLIPIDTTAPCPADTNNDNTVGPDDLFLLLANFGQAVINGPADGDVAPEGNPDGTVTPDDLFFLLANFGATCD